MLNKLTIRKQSDLNDLIKIVYNFIKLGGNIQGMSYISAEYVFDGIYKDERVIFETMNTDEIIMSTDLVIDEAYKLYTLVEKID